MLSKKLEWSKFFIYSKFFQLCTKVKSRKCGQMMHSRLIVHGFSLNDYFVTRLIIFYSKIGDLGSARKLFDGMRERSVVAWTALISGYAQNGGNEEALRVFSWMRSERTSANQFTYCSALRACTGLQWLEAGNQIQGCLQKSKFVHNVFVQSALVDFHGKCGKIEDACSIFKCMEIRDLVSWNAMIGGYAAQGLNKNAIIGFCQMLGEGFLPDSFSFGNILKACFGNDGLTTVCVIHGYISKFGFESHKFVSGSLVDAYIKCGSLATAHELYMSLENKDVVSCTALIKGYASEGTNPIEGLRLFVEAQSITTTDEILLCSMLNVCAKTASLNLGRQLHAKLVKYHSQPDIVADNALIDMYSKSGEIGDARRVFNEMEVKNVISWTSLIAGCGKHGHGDEAFRLYAEMENEGLKPNDVTLLCLLSACSHNGSTTRGWKCFATMIIKHQILPRREHFSCLVGVLARAGHVDEAYDLVCKLGGAVEEGFALSTILGGCSMYEHMALGQRISQRLFLLEPENPANRVVMSGIYAAAGLWNKARETRMLMHSKHPGCSS